MYLPVRGILELANLTSSEQIVYTMLDSYRLYLAELKLTDIGSAPNLNVML